MFFLLQVPPTSPNVHANTLQNEFRSLSAIRDVGVQFDPQNRKCYVNIKNKGDHRICLCMSFPENYPGGRSPTFRFDTYTTMDKTLQVCLINVLSIYIF